MNPDIEILGIINDYHNLSQGKCGITPVEIATKLNKPYSEIRNSFINLYKENKISVRKGVNSILLFKA